MNLRHRVRASFFFGLTAAFVGAPAQGQTLGPVVVQGQPIPALYDFQVVGPEGNQFSISAIGFPSGNMLPQSVRNAIQWTDPNQPPPNVGPPIFFYQVNDPDGALSLSQLLIGNQFGAMGFIDGAINLNQPAGMATLNIPPQTPTGNLPNDPIRRAGSVGAPPPFQNTIAYLDPQPTPDGLRNTIVVGLAVPGTFVAPRGVVAYGQADPQSEPTNPNAAGGNDEFSWVPGPAMPDPCIDDTLLTLENFDYLKFQETKNGVTITSETEVVNFQTVRDRIVSTVKADDGFTYVTVVENFVTKAFYRFPTGGVDPKGIIPAPADFEEDGDVDAADLALWSAGFGAASGATHGQGDADGDGAVTGCDFMIWQRQLAGPAPLPVATAVPEPGVWALVITGALATVAGARSRGAPARA
jgi:hypothetical protein